MTIGERITFLRTKNNLSISALAKLSGVPISTLHYLEAGKRDERVMDGEKLTLNTGKRLAKAFGVTLDYLAGMYDEDA